MSQILRDSPSDVRDIEVHKDGSWSVVKDDDEEEFSGASHHRSGSSRPVCYSIVADSPSSKKKPLSGVTVKAGIPHSSNASDAKGPKRHLESVDEGAQSISQAAESQSEMISVIDLDDEDDAVEPSHQPSPHELSPSTQVEEILNEASQAWKSQESGKVGPGTSMVPKSLRKLTSDSLGSEARVSTPDLEVTKKDSSSQHQSSSSALQSQKLSSCSLSIKSPLITDSGEMKSHKREPCDDNNAAKRPIDPGVHSVDPIAGLEISSQEPENSVKEREQSAKQHENSVKEHENSLKDQENSVEEPEKSAKGQERFVEESKISTKEQEHSAGESKISAKEQQNVAKEHNNSSRKAPLTVGAVGSATVAERKGSPCEVWLSDDDDENNGAAAGQPPNAKSSSAAALSEGECSDGESEAESEGSLTVLPQTIDLTLESDNEDVDDAESNTGKANKLENSAAVPPHGALSAVHPRLNSLRDISNPPSEGPTGAAAGPRSVSADPAEYTDYDELLRDALASRKSAGSAELLSDGDSARQRNTKDLAAEKDANSDVTRSSAAEIKTTKRRQTSSHAEPNRPADTIRKRVKGGYGPVDGAPSTDADGNSRSVGGPLFRLPFRTSSPIEIDLPMDSSSDDGSSNHSLRDEDAIEIGSPTTIRQGDTHSPKDVAAISRNSADDDSQSSSKDHSESKVCEIDLMLPANSRSDEPKSNDLAALIWESSSATEQDEIVIDLCSREGGEGMKRGASSPSDLTASLDDTEADTEVEISANETLPDVANFDCDTDVTAQICSSGCSVAQLTTVCSAETTPSTSSSESCTIVSSHSVSSEISATERSLRKENSPSGGSNECPNSNPAPEVASSGVLDTAASLSGLIAAASTSRNASCTNDADQLSSCEVPEKCKMLPDRMDLSRSGYNNELSDDCCSSVTSLEVGVDLPIGCNVDDHQVNDDDADVFTGGEVRFQLPTVEMDLVDRLPSPVGLVEADVCAVSLEDEQPTADPPAEDGNTSGSISPKPTAANRLTDPSSLEEAVEEDCSNKEAPNQSVVDAQEKPLPAGNVDIASVESRSRVEGSDGSPDWSTSYCRSSILVAAPTVNTTGDVVSAIEDRQSAAGVTSDLGCVQFSSSVEGSSSLSVNPNAVAAGEGSLGGDGSDDFWNDFKPMTATSSSDAAAKAEPKPKLPVQADEHGQKRKTDQLCGDLLTTTGSSEQELTAARGDDTAETKCKKAKLETDSKRICDGTRLEAEFIKPHGLQDGFITDSNSSCPGGLGPVSQSASNLTGSDADPSWQGAAGPSEDQIMSASSSNENSQESTECNEYHVQLSGISFWKNHVFTHDFNNADGFTEHSAEDVFTIVASSPSFPMPRRWLNGETRVAPAPTNYFNALYSPILNKSVLLTSQTQNRILYSPPLKLAKASLGYGVMLHSPKTHLMSKISSRRRQRCLSRTRSKLDKELLQAYIASGHRTRKEIRSTLRRCRSLSRRKCRKYPAAKSPRPTPGCGMSAPNALVGTMYQLCKVLKRSLAQVESSLRLVVPDATELDSQTEVGHSSAQVCPKPGLNVSQETRISSLEGWAARLYGSRRLVPGCLPSNHSICPLQDWGNFHPPHPVGITARQGSHLGQNCRIFACRKHRYRRPAFGSRRCCLLSQWPPGMVDSSCCSTVGFFRTCRRRRLLSPVVSSAQRRVKRVGLSAPISVHLYGMANESCFCGCSPSRDLLMTCDWSGNGISLLDHFDWLVGCYNLCLCDTGRWIRR